MYYIWTFSLDENDIETAKGGITGVLYQKNVQPSPDSQRRYRVSFYVNMKTTKTYSDQCNVYETLQNAKYKGKIYTDIITGHMLESLPHM